MTLGSDRSLYARFARQILEAVGAGSLTLAAASCGGSVTEQGIGGDTSGGAGGAAGSAAAGTSTSTATSTTTNGSTTGSSTSASTTSAGTSGAGGSAPFGCEANLPAGQKLVYACLANGAAQPCPENTEPSVQTQLATQLGTPGCPSYAVIGVACGPDPTVESCCYYAILQEELCEGRPFTVDGQVRTAPVCARAGWAASVSPDVAHLDPATRQALADAWGREAAFEHASIASFARFALELLSAGAPIDLVLDAQRAMGDELRHAELCFGLASAYASAPLGPGRLAMEGALAGRDDLVAIAVATVREGCIGETVAALVAAAARDASEDPAVREALDRIAGDEAAHAALAWRFVAWAVKDGSADVQRAVIAAFAHHPPADSATSYPREADAHAMRAHGRLDANEVRTIAERAWTDVITPCAQTMLHKAHTAAVLALRNC